MLISGGVCSLRSVRHNYDGLCDAVAVCAIRIATAYVDPVSLEAYTACRLIPQDKNPGVRPIGIGEVMRRIIGKAIMGVLGNIIQEIAGSIQLCAGQECGVGAAVHAICGVFQSPEVGLID